MAPLTTHSFPAPEDQIGDGGFAAGGADEHRDLAAVIPRMAEQLCKDVFHAIAESAGIEAFILERLLDILVGLRRQKSLPKFLSFTPLGSHIGQFGVFREKSRRRSQCAQPIKPDAPCRNDMSHNRHGFAILRTAAPLGRNAIERSKHFCVRVLFILEPTTIPFNNHDDYPHHSPLTPHHSHWPLTPRFFPMHHKCSLVLRKI